MTNTKNHYRVVGLMSGTSLDGVDLVLCRFSFGLGGWKYDIDRAETYPYNTEWLDKLEWCFQQERSDLDDMHTAYGRYLGELCNDFITGGDEHPDLIASHGHTIFHKPEEGFTFQLGRGDAIAKATGVDVVYDFRSGDMMLGGKGAPLVPIGDSLLFGDYRACLNLGGFANISYEKDGLRQAHDITACNMILNRLALREGLLFDEGGLLARQGKIIKDMLLALNQVAYFNAKGSLSLGREWVEQHLQPIVNDSGLAHKDVLRTYVEHIAFQVGDSMAGMGESDRVGTLVTGGGAYNSFLMERMQAYCQDKLIIPGPQLIDYKEALIFGLMGVLRIRDEVNCLRSVTGATKDSSGGIVVKATGSRV